jgi:hypothetical protein
MLTGADLIAFVKENDGMNQMELARGAGYLRVTRTGKEQVLVKQFYNSLLAAKGTPIPLGRTPGKSAQYATSVHKSGVILLGRTYSERFGLNPGDELEIVLEEDCIKLVPLPVHPVVGSEPGIKRVVVTAA